MMQLVDINESTAILDIGGAPGIWNHDFLPRLTITILNLPGAIEQSHDSRHNIAYADGDGCDVRGIPDKSFDFVFSNSVIEHVGGADRRASFAAEVRRLGRSYWVQTPCIHFPIEAHTGMPFWWYYPNILRKPIIDGWRRKLPAWTDMVEGTTVLSKQELRGLFPDAEILTERFLGIPKSYIALKV